ncbi:MAG: sugar ABC transporter ATP-binding protein [Caldilineaceae bacterium]
MTQPLLAMHHITKTFGGVHALTDVSFACQAGTVHALLGENGAGKSTLMKILAGAYQADRGEIVFKGERYTHFSTRQALDLGIRIVYQELNLLPMMSVAENIFLGHEPRNRFGVIDQRHLVRETRNLLARLGIALDPHELVGDLPVASQQIVEIAKALSEQADLIVMDEPSAILAGHELAKLFAIIRTLKAEGVTVIYISHRLNEIFEIADDVTVLKDGKLVDSAPIAAVNRRDLITMMVGRTLEEIFPQSTSQRGDAVLVATALQNRRLRNVSLTLHAGEIVGLAGMVGAGRSEVARALFGADPLNGGTITINGKQLAAPSPRRAIGAGLALAPEDRKGQGLLVDQAIRTNLTLPVLGQLARHGLIQRDREDTLLARACNALAIVMASPDQEVQALSGGNQQKVVLAKWLETKPTVMILDEPTRGIDVGAKFEIYQLIRQLADRGVAILMISSELPEILGMSDRILVMNDGRLAGELTRAEATEERIVELATIENR